MKLHLSLFEKVQMSVPRVVWLIIAAICAIGFVISIIALFRRAGRNQDSNNIGVIISVAASLICLSISLFLAKPPAAGKLLKNNIIVSPKLTNVEAIGEYGKDCFIKIKNSGRSGELASIEFDGDKAIIRPLSNSGRAYLKAADFLDKQDDIAKQKLTAGLDQTTVIYQDEFGDHSISYRAQDFN